MENATKALLIAAAVLISIVLIALGVNLLKAGGDTAGQAGSVAGKLDEGIGSAADKVTGGLSSLGGKVVYKSMYDNKDDFAKWNGGYGLPYLNNPDYECKCYVVESGKTVPTTVNQQIWEDAKKEYPSNLTVETIKILGYDNNTKVVFVTVVKK